MNLWYPLKLVENLTEFRSQISFFWKSEIVNSSRSVHITLSNPPKNWTMIFWISWNNLKPPVSVSFPWPIWKKAMVRADLNSWRVNSKCRIHPFRLGYKLSIPMPLCVWLMIFITAITIYCLRVYVYLCNF